jgi:hypothetical protein
MIGNTTPRISKEPTFTSADEVPFLPKFIIEQNPTQSEQYHLELKEWWESVYENLQRIQDMVVSYQVAETRETSSNELSVKAQLLTDLAHELTDNLDGKLTGNITNLDASLSQIITNLDTSLSQSITNLDTSLSQSITNVDTSLSQSITNVDTSLSQRITSVDTSLSQSLASHSGQTNNPHSVTKGQVGLGNVQNTALSTWPGSQNITTLGTIATGTVPAANISGLNAVATSGAYNDLSGTPTFTYDASSSTLTINT